MKCKDPKQRKYITCGLIPLAVFFMFILDSCSQGNGINEADAALVITTTNSTDMVMQNVLVELCNSDLLRDSENIDPANFVVFSSEQEIPSQMSDDKLCFIIDELAPGGDAQYTLKEGRPGFKYVKKTQAEISVKEGGYFENGKYIGGDFKNINYLRVPDEHTDHSFYIRYEGPGWESDLVGYRFYLDWRNATDVFGKKTNEMVLQQVGLDGFDSYHEMQNWGMDVLKVGSSLGIGSLGIFDNGEAIRIDQTDSVFCRVLENGPIYSAIKTEYYGWKVANQELDVESVLSIHACTRLTHHEVTLSGYPQNLCTGIVKDDHARLYADEGSGGYWGYVATYGFQSLNNDKLGLAIFFSPDSYQGFTEDEFSHIVKLRSTDNKLDYYFMAAWEGEKNGMKSEDEFIFYVKQKAAELSNPIKISFKY